MLFTTLIFYNYFFSAISLKCIEYKKINCYEKYVGQFAIKFLKNPFCWGIRRTDWIYCKLSFWSFKTWWLCTWTELRFVHSYPLMVYRISFKVRSWLFAFAASSHLQSFAAVGFVYETLLKWKCHYIFKINIKKLGQAENSLRCPFQRRWFTKNCNYLCKFAEVPPMTLLPRSP